MVVVSVNQREIKNIWTRTNTEATLPWLFVWSLTDDLSTEAEDAAPSSDSSSTRNTNLWKNIAVERGMGEVVKIIHSYFIC